MSWRGLTLVHVVAMDRKRCIGKDNQLPWHLPADLQHFKTITAGGVMLMGRKTFASIGRPLPGRISLVLTRNRDWRHEGVMAGTDLHGLLDQAAGLAQERGQDSIFVIGGGEIFAQTLPWLDRLVLTEVDTVVGGDAFYPPLPSDLEERSRTLHRDPASGLGFAFVELWRAVQG